MGVNIIFRKNLLFINLYLINICLGIYLNILYANSENESKNKKKKFLHVIRRKSVYFRVDIVIFTKLMVSVNL